MRRPRQAAPAKGDGRWARGAAVALLALLPLAAACGIRGKVERLFGGRFEVAVNVSPEINRRVPVAVDLLVVYDRSLLETLGKMTAREWFAGREQFLKDHAGVVDSHLWEWVPGQTVETQVVPYRLGALGGFVFARYLFSPGPHRQAIDPHRSILLQLGPDAMRVSRLRGRRE